MTIARPSPTIEVLPRDLSAWEQGNCGVPFVHRFDSGLPGPTVMVVGLTHGNEFCGAETLHWALSEGLRPQRGVLILAFSNVAAYRSFTLEKPYESRFLDRDMNRVWRDDWLSSEQTREAARARELLPFVQQADYLLDIHSTTFAIRPFFVCANVDRSRDFALGVGFPRTVLLEGGMPEDKVMVEYGAFADPKSSKIAVLVECGGHFLQSTTVAAKAAFLDFLVASGALAADVAALHRPTVPEPPAGLYDITYVHTAKTADLSYAQPFVGFEEVAEGELIARDGDLELRAPYPRCAILFPKASPAKGREFVSLARRLD